MRDRPVERVALERVRERTVSSVPLTEETVRVSTKDKAETRCKGERMGKRRKNSMKVVKLVVVAR